MDTAPATGSVPGGRILHWGPPCPAGQACSPTPGTLCLCLFCLHDIEARLLITWQLPWLCQSPPGDAAAQDQASMPLPGAAEKGDEGISPKAPTLPTAGATPAPATGCGFPGSHVTFAARAMLAVLQTRLRQAACHWCGVTALSPRTPPASTGESVLARCGGLAARLPLLPGRHRQVGRHHSGCLCTLLPGAPLRRTGSGRGHCANSLALTLIRFVFLFFLDVFIGLNLHPARCLNAAAGSHQAAGFQQAFQLTVRFIPA